MNVARNGFETRALRFAARDSCNFFSNRILERCTRLWNVLAIAARCCDAAMTEPTNPRILIAHEINNPLATLIANLALVEQEIARVAAELDIGDRLRAAIEELRDARASADRLRAIVAEIVPPAGGAAQEVAPRPEPAARRGKILVIDDEPLVARSLGRVLEPEHDVTIVLSAGDAHRRVTAGERFDVILCDLMMPEMTGMDLHAELLLSAPEQAAQMVFLTGGAFTPRARAFLSGISNERLQKPFDLQQLRSIVNDRVR
jgi:CheY-like chemotaxis protein